MLVIMYVLPEKDLIKKAATIKRFEYSPLHSELKKQTDVARKQYQRLDKVYKFDKNEKDETINKEEKDGKNPILKNIKNQI